MFELILLGFLVILVVYAFRGRFGFPSGNCSRCGRYARRLIPNEDARKSLLLCKMCNAELEIERSLKVTGSDH